MSCSNCFNGCADIVSDKCVKYTGIDIPGLGISTGDNLLIVENQITSKILELMNGSGIIPIIDQNDLCALVSSFLPCCTTITLNDVISALIQSICSLDSRTTIIEGQIAALNADYNVDCLTGVVATTDTHDIVQAIITKLCQVSNDLDILELDVATNYLLISEVDYYIAAYLATIPEATLWSSKMIPYVAMPYFSGLTGPGVGNGFDITGAGFGTWLNVYLCNGQNGTPDLRGRVIVGATTMGPPPYNPAVDPSIPGNPTYNLNDANGANSVVLTLAQIPSHNHSTVVSLNDPGHTHLIYSNTNNASGGGSEHVIGVSNIGDGTQPATTGITVGVTVNANGGGTTHPNVQPGIGANMIIYIP